MTNAAPALKSRTIPIVFVEYATTGKHSSVHSAPLHEVILIRERLRDQHESVIVHDEWPAHIAAYQVQMRPITEEHGRLMAQYDAKENARPYFKDVYGAMPNCRLEEVARRIHDLFTRGMKPSKLIELGRPDSAFLDVVEDAVATETVAAIVATPVVVATVVQPSPEQSAGYQLPAGDQPVAVNGKLIDHLIGCGWEPNTATGVANLVAAADGQAVPDDKLREIRGITNKPAIMKLRDHLAMFQG